MLHTPQIGDGVCAAAVKIILEVHLVQHTFHIGHTNLKRGVDLLPAQLFVNKAGILLGDQPFAVEADDLDIGHRLHPVIFAGAVLCPVVLHRDHLCGRGRSYRIVNDHHPVRLVDADTVDADTAGQHQSVVGVELAELAVTLPNSSMKITRNFPRLFSLLYLVLSSSRMLSAVPSTESF